VMKKTVLALKPYSAIALIFAIISHGLLIAGFLAARSPTASSATRHKGAPLIQVGVRFVPAPIVIQPTIQPATTRPIHAQKPTPTPAPVEQKTEQSPPESAAQEAPAPPLAAATGGKFVSPFAPIISQPLGRSSWRTSRPPPPGIDPAELQRQQARLQLRTMLMDRLGNWVAWQTQQQHTEVSCLLRLDLAAQQGKLSCIPAEKEAEVWSVLNGLMAAGAADSNDTLCLRIGTSQLTTINCNATP
jgi:hypothetical protein